MKTVTLYRPNNAGSIGSVFHDFDRYLDSFFGDSLFSPAAGYAERLFNHAPAVDIRETGDAYRLEAELPGFDEKNVEVRLDGGMLTIESREEKAAEKKEEAGERKETYLLRERRNASFSRSFKLPENADQDSITASFKNGVLSLEIKKLAEARKRTIQIEKK
jgi:HSP20 family protein